MGVNSLGSWAEPDSIFWYPWLLGNRSVWNIISRTCTEALRKVRFKCRRTTPKIIKRDLKSQVILIIVGFILNYIGQQPGNPLVFGAIGTLGLIFILVGIGNLLFYGYRKYFK